MRRFGENLPSMAMLTSGGAGGSVPEEMLRVPAGAELVADTAPARWIEDRLRVQPWARVGSLVPSGFDACGRVLHPAYRNEDGESVPVRWAAVASWTGRVAHPLMQFSRIANMSDDPNEQPSWGSRPSDGTLPAETADRLVAVLREFTSTPDLCWFCVWEGYGGLDLVLEYHKVRHVETPNRGYLLLRGPLDAIKSFDGWTVWEQPSIWWPDDHAWCVSTNIDLDSTYVGGTKECIDGIINHPELEAFRANLDDRVDIDADTINRP